MGKGVFVILGNIASVIALYSLNNMLFGDHRNSFAVLIAPFDKVLSALIIYGVMLCMAYHQFYRNERMPQRSKLAKTHLLCVVSTIPFQIFSFFQIGSNPSSRLSSLLPWVINFIWLASILVSVSVQSRFK